MERYWIEELKARCLEICTIDMNQPDMNQQDMIARVIECYDRILRFAEITRKEGLLALDEAKEELDKDEETAALFYKLITLVVDGTDPKIVSIIGANRYATTNLMSYGGLMNLMYIRGALMIQGGDGERIISEVLKSMMPKPIMDKLECREKDNEVLREEKKEKEYANQIKQLCKDDGAIDERVFYVVNELSESIMNLSSQDVQKLLQEIDMSTLSVAMKGLPGKARARIFGNLSHNLSYSLVEQISYMGPVRLKDVEEYCAKILKILLELRGKGVIREN